MVFYYPGHLINKKECKHGAVIEVCFVRKESIWADDKFIKDEECLKCIKDYKNK